MSKKNYFIGGYNWGVNADECQFDRFIRDGIWEFDPQAANIGKLSNVFNQIAVGDLFALKTVSIKAEQSLMIKRIGKVTNIIDNSSISIDWFYDSGDVTLKKLGTIYQKALHQITDKAEIYDIFFENGCPKCGLL